MTLESEVRSRVREIQNGIRNGKDHRQFVECLKNVCKYLPCVDSSKKGDNKEKEEQECSKIFLKNHYTSFAKFLLDSVTFETVGHLTKSEFTQYFLHFFLNGCCEDAFLAVTFAIYNTGPSFKLNKCVIILEEFLKKHKFVDIFREQSALNKDRDTPMYNWRSDGRVLLWDSIITEMASLPDKMANKLRSETSDIFLPKHYIPLLISDILRTLVAVCKYIRLSKDCHLEFVSCLVGKLCLCGYADQFWFIMLKQTTTLVRKDFIWSRVCERIVTGVPDRCMESVLVPLVKLLPWYGLMDRYIGNCVTQKQKIQLLLCTKLIFHRHYKSPLVLQNVIGYLATSTPRQHLFIKLFLELIQVWGDQSSLNHTSYEQHYYLTQAFVICMAFLTENHKQEHKDEILRLLMPGIQTHISSSEPKVRKLGMFVAEIVTTAIDPEGPKLNFEVEADEEIVALRGLLHIPEDRVMDFMHEEFAMMLSERAGDLVLFGLDDASILGEQATEEPVSNKSQQAQKTQEPDSDLDSDDDLEPYDMSHDTQVSKVKQPKYIRDCMEGLINCENPDTLEACLGAAESLVRANPDGLAEISAEFAKVLLHLTESYSLPYFRSQRFSVLVALAVTCPKQVAEYLTEQFYDRNYSIRQRLDIIEVVGTAAQELSRPVDPSKKPTPEVKQKVQELSASSSDPESWRDVVQRRIDSKTRRFGQGKTKPDPQPVENKFSAVAGYFFYPLMQNFDRKENTFDLMGEDCYVLSRLMYTLGIVMYAASNIPTVRQMASCLLEFIWVLRFHSDSNVRQGLLFAISMVYLAVPPNLLLKDLQQEVFESKNWLEDVIDKDVDTQCKTLAVQALVLLENIIKQEFLSDIDLT
ncbi:telomere length regulation protein TEL2 homolog [Mercenaria mercenaria]|uniref:telomere length regulation protein TEL2 homolog n=1 Tax=Mercenaria mercenaria TaxID=6596 RepID=UPI00234E4572|nr:telomere length regulation protein TEL2 homolog [Mercenaria mercenaria]XP_053386098.1 telomere length regulation protein TEL2 homolog [Mercenaria mercenaria]XP_053386109.1 telomere length regulation protein TEL2 homolog [Mercenaria mercenaria]